MKKYMDIARLQASPEIVEIKEVIEIIFRVGDGTESNPIRYTKQYWDVEGNLLFENDFID